VNNVVLTYVVHPVGCLIKTVTSVHGYEQDKLFSVQND